MNTAQKRKRTSQLVLSQSTGSRNWSFVQQGVGIVRKSLYFEGGKPIPKAASSRPNVWSCGAKTVSTLRLWRLQNFLQAKACTYRGHVTSNAICRTLRLCGRADIPGGSTHICLKLVTKIWWKMGHALGSNWFQEISFLQREITVAWNWCFLSQYDKMKTRVPSYKYLQFQNSSCLKCSARLVITLIGNPSVRVMQL
jgi:hypothetical protein